MYDKNRVFKLPYQTKGVDLGSRKPQKPINDLLRLEDFLISHGLPSNVNAIEVPEVHHQVASIRLQGRSCVNNTKAKRRISAGSHDVLEEFVTHYTGKNVSTIPDGEPSWSPGYLVNSIFNDHTMPYNIWMKVGSAIKRVHLGENDDGFQMFCRWSEKWTHHPDEFVAKSRAAGFDADQSSKWRSFSTEKCGYPTLKRLALQCNSKLVDLLATPWTILFANELVRKKAFTEHVSQRFINFDIRQKVRDYRTVFVQSPMGTGKSHAVKELFKEPSIFNKCTLNDLSLPLLTENVLYLSSKRAFASAMTAEFEKFGFVNYMNPATKTSKTKVRRLFCSLESLDRFVRLHKNLYDDLDLLIVDESESVFSVVSSETLKSNKPLKNLLTFTHVMKRAKRVVVMDAHMTDRTVEPLVMLRNLNPNNAYFIHNTFLPEQRFCKVIRKKIQEKIVSEVNASLSAGKRCVAVIGSKKFADGLVKSVKELQKGKNVKYYNRDQRLDDTVDVKKEWKTCDLLVYTPTITCGVNFPRVSQDDDQVLTGSTSKNYNRKILYTGNVGFTHCRDTLQSSHRVRHCTERTITLGLAIRPVQERELYPVTMGGVADRLHSLKKITDQTCSQSVEDIVDLKWVFRTMVFNQLERNLNVLYLPQIVQEYFRRENIHITRQPCTSEEVMVHQSFYKVENDDWKYDEIELIDDATYQSYATDEVNRRCFLELEQRKLMAKYQFVKRSRTKNVQHLKTMFDLWHSEHNRPYLLQVFLFKRAVYRSNKLNESHFVYDQQTDLQEFFQQTRRSFPHILFMYKKLGLIDSKGVLNLSHKFTTLDLKALLNNEEDESKGRNYKSYTKLQINDLIRGTNYVYREKSQKMTCDTLRSMVNLLTKSFFNYEIDSEEDIPRRTVDGVKVTTYSVKPRPVSKGRPRPRCIFSFLKDDWPDRL